VALLPWYIGISEGLGNTYSFPDPQALTAPAKPCPPVTVASPPPKPTVATALVSGPPNGHQLIGYWTGTFPLREVSPQWDLILVAFGEPDKNAPQGTIQFDVRPGLDREQFKADIAYLKS
jgi:chitinase